MTGRGGKGGLTLEGGEDQREEEKFLCNLDTESYTQGWWIKYGGGGGDGNWWEESLNRNNVWCIYVIGCF